MGTAENPYAGRGSVLLDIGGDVGALVVVMPPALDGVEIEIKPAAPHGHQAHGEHGEHRADQPGGDAHHQDHHDHGHEHDHDHGPVHHPHVAVVARPVSGGLVHSLVFPELVAGGYELYRKPDGPVELSVSVIGGEVTEARWPELTA
jgi:hypothetical protein